MKITLQEKKQILKGCENINMKTLNNIKADNYLRINKITNIKKEIVEIPEGELISITFEWDGKRATLLNWK